MGFRDRFDAQAARLGEGARKAMASAPARQASEKLQGIRAMFEDDEHDLSVERFLLVLVRAVRNDERAEGRSTRDVFELARKRRRRLAVLSFGAGPLVGVANQLADLYCETAIVCDLAVLHRLDLGDEHVAAHMLVLWQVMEDVDTAYRAMTGEQAFSGILAGRLRESADGRLPEQLTKQSIAKALWDVGDAVRDMRRRGMSDAALTAAFAGHRTKRFVKLAEAQLGVV